MSLFTESLEKLLAKRSLAREEMRAAMNELMSGRWSTGQIAGFLVALRLKGETVDELAGAAEAMRAAAVSFKTKASLVVDTCGTGGDGSGSFNLSTAAAFIVAGAGFTVAKHGNRSVSSRSGSADVLEALGVPLQSDVSQIEACLEQVGIAFLFAPAFHPATQVAMPARKELGVRTIFNLLGPLTNPANPQVQIIGVYSLAWVKPLAEVLVTLGRKEGVVVHGMGHDEVVLCGETQVAEVDNGVLHERQWHPKDFGVECLPAETLKGGTPPENAKLMLDVLQNRPSAYRDAACINAAALIQAARRHPAGGNQNISLAEAFRVAVESLAGGHALNKLNKLKEALKTSRV